MKASRLISNVQKLIDTFGDLDVELVIEKMCGDNELRIIDGHQYTSPPRSVSSGGEVITIKN